MNTIKPDERVKSILQTLKIGIYQTEPTINDKVMFINQSGASILGCASPNEVIGNKFNSFFSNADEYGNFINSLDKEDTDEEFEILCKEPDGEERMVCIIASLAKDNDGSNLRIDGTIKDIQKNKEEELETEIVLNIYKILSSNIDMREVYQIVCDELYRKINWDRVSISLLEESGKAIIDFVVTKGRESDFQVQELPEKGRHPFVGSILEKVTTTGKPFIVEDTTKNLTVTDKYFTKNGLLSRLSYPLRFKDKITGSVNLSCKQRNYYNEGHTKLLAKIAPFLAVAIENTKLFIKFTKSEQEYKDLFSNIENRWL